MVQHARGRMPRASVPLAHPPWRQRRPLVQPRQQREQQLGRAHLPPWEWAPPSSPQGPPPPPTAEEGDVWGFGLRDKGGAVKGRAGQGTERNGRAGQGRAGQGGTG